MAQELIRQSVDDAGVAVIALHDPKTRNALSDDLLDGLLDALEGARHNSEVRVVVLTSTDDRVLSSGGNLNAFADDRSAIEKYGELDRFPALYKLIGSLGKPVICAANGDVLAGAFGLALACDLIIAKDSVRFGCPEINVGVFPFMISALIYRNLPRIRANEMMMLGGLITATQARDLGIVNAVVPAEEFEQTVQTWARRIAAKSPLLMKLGKNAINASRDLSLNESLDLLQAQLALAFTTEDIAEGVKAFREKRPPNWTNR